MYEVDDRDVVVPLEGIPQSSTGAPLTLIMADEHFVVLAYHMQAHRPWTGVPQMISAVDSDEPIAIVRFDGHTHMFGGPNDETLSGHPLWGRGLKHYGAFRIENSSWIRKLERMNSVHRMHNPDTFWKLQHLALTFHDSTFECVCKGFEVSTAQGSIHEVVPKMVKLLRRAG
jgi:hypothetical protein